MVLLASSYTECFKSSSNRFEQFCINYANEKIQHLCTQRLIQEEQLWYQSEGIEVPEIQFPGNDMILGGNSSAMFVILCNMNLYLG